MLEVARQSAGRTGERITAPSNHGRDRGRVLPDAEAVEAGRVHPDLFRHGVELSLDLQGLGEGREDGATVRGGVAGDCVDDLMHDH